MSKTKKWLVTILVFILLAVELFFVVRPKLHSVCTQHNTIGLRSGSCDKEAPFFCKTTYYPAVCKGCQDAEGCGF